ncbi:MAG: hypothetical protein ACJASQ_002667 [Crocinitomicaceae bacterium]|jgi:hypothetical protein
MPETTGVTGINYFVKLINPIQSNRQILDVP